MLPSLSPRSRSAALLTLLLALVVGLPTVQGASSAARVSIGDVVVELERTVGGREAEFGRVLRVALAEELAALAATGGTGKRPLVLSATLTKLSTERRAERARASASISLVLRRADDHVLLAELRGRASVEETSDSVVTVQREAVRGAVRGALARLPEAVRRAR